MKRTLLLALAWGALGSGSPALAQDVQRSDSYRACMRAGDAARGVTSAMMNCGGAELELWDRRLNSAYRSAMERLPARRRLALRNEQRRWIMSRDRACDAASQTGGSIDALVNLDCLIDRTVLRSAVLRRIR